MGAGAGGICMAWYLKLAGYRNVQVLEKSPRLGGKCRSVTVQGQSFDLGANYITSAYKRVRALAKHVDADMYTEKAGHVIDVKTGHVRSILRGILSSSRVSLFTLMRQSLIYIWKRWRLRKLLSPARPGFAHVKDHPEIQGNFEQWLRSNGMYALVPMFEIPLTLMGYGKLDKIPTAYALTYMSLGTFKDLGMFAANLPLRCWPRRFTKGYGRLFERLAAEVDVLTGVNITAIERDGKEVRVEYQLLEQQLEGNTTSHEEAFYDYLVLACPQVPEVLDSLNMTPPYPEKLFKKVEYNPFFVTTYKAPGTQEIAAVTFSMPIPELGRPYVVTRQYPENDFISVYTRGDREGKITREHVMKENSLFLDEIHAKNPQEHDFSCDDWAYFPHVSADEMDKGFYHHLEALQGEDRTFYCGGLLGFELVECIAEHAHYLVQTHFVGKK